MMLGQQYWSVEQLPKNIALMQMIESHNSKMVSANQAGARKFNPKSKASAAVPSMAPAVVASGSNSLQPSKAFSQKMRNKVSNLNLGPGIGDIEGPSNAAFKAPPRFGTVVGTGNMTSVTAAPLTQRYQNSGQLSANAFQGVLDAKQSSTTPRQAIQARANSRKSNKGSIPQLNQGFPVQEVEVQEALTPT